MKQFFSASYWGYPAIISLLVTLIDQLTKGLTVLLCPVPGAAECIIIPHVLRFVHWRNMGAAFSMFFGHKLILGILSLAATLYLIFSFDKLFGTKRNSRFAGAALIGGIIGNLIDRFFYSDGVIDFIRFEYWPAFNIADSVICCTMVYFAWTIWHSDTASKDDSASKEEKDAFPE